MDAKKKAQLNAEMEQLKKLVRQDLLELKAKREAEARQKAKKVTYEQR
jgi:hypothetical protein